jgi:hypothetical protein
VRPDAFTLGEVPRTVGTLVAKDDPLHLKGLQRGFHAKGDRESVGLEPLMAEACFSTYRNEKTCFLREGHAGPCSWEEAA